MVINRVNKRIDDMRVKVRMHNEDGSAGIWKNGHSVYSLRIRRGWSLVDKQSSYNKLYKRFEYEKFR